MTNSIDNNTYRPASAGGDGAILQDNTASTTAEEEDDRLYHIDTSNQKNETPNDSENPVGTEIIAEVSSNAPTEVSKGGLQSSQRLPRSPPATPKSSLKKQPQPPSSSATPAMPDPLERSERTLGSSSRLHPRSLIGRIYRREPAGRGGMKITTIGSAGSDLPPEDAARLDRHLRATVKTDNLRTGATVTFRGGEGEDEFEDIDILSTSQQGQRGRGQGRQQGDDEEGGSGAATWKDVAIACCRHSPSEWLRISGSVGILAGLLYFFMFALDLMGTSFQVVGGCTAGSLLGSDTNPLGSVVIGILATALLQSSSTTTAIIVSLVSGGLDVQQGIYMVMGANVGTAGMSKSD